MAERGLPREAPDPDQGCEKTRPQRKKPKKPEKPKKRTRKKPGSFGFFGFFEKPGQKEDTTNGQKALRTGSWPAYKHLCMRPIRQFQKGSHRFHGQKR